MRVTVSIPDPLGEEAEALAREQGVSVSALYAEAMQAYLRELRRQEALESIRDLIGKVDIAPDALAQLQDERRRSDRR